MKTDAIDAAIKRACGSPRVLDSYTYEDVCACVAEYSAVAKNLLQRSLRVTVDVGEELTLEAEIREFLA